MRILLAHKFHHITGGAEVFYFEVARILKDNGNKVAFFSTAADNNIITGDPSYFVQAPRYQSGSVFEKVVGSQEIFYSASKLKAMRAAIEEFKPDILHVFAIHVHLTPSILEAAKCFGIPVVMSCNDYKHICPNYKLFANNRVCESCKGRRFYQATLKRCCKGSMIYSVASSIEAIVHEHKKVYDRLVDRYLFASQFMLNKTEEFWSDKQINYGTLKNPFDAAGYQPVYRGEYALYFGRIIDEKGVNRIVDAARLVDMPVKIIGDGPNLAKLQTEVAQHSLTHVEFLGPKWAEDLKQVLYGARFVIVPSLWHENFPYVIFQAFAAGKPVIGSLRGGIPELIGEERGVLFEPDNVEELANSMESLWYDVDGCQRMGELAREYVVREFSDDIIYESLMSNYQAVLQ